MNNLALFGAVAVGLVLFVHGCVLQTASEPTPTAYAPAGDIESFGSTSGSKADTRFVLRSPEVTEGGMLPEECTCDGSSATLPLEWSGEPADTQSFALVMYTIPGPNESHCYWVLYNISASVHTLAKNVTGVGTLGSNSINGRTEYAPPCSKGPGPKLYTFTIYALSAPPQFTVPTTQVSRDVLLSAISDRTLGSAKLNAFYSR